MQNKSIIPVNPHSVLRMSVKSLLFAQAGIPFMLNVQTRNKITTSVIHDR